MRNDGMTTQYYTMSTASKLQSGVLDTLFVNTNKDRHSKHRYLRVRQVSDTMVILLIIQTRSHVNGVEWDTCRIKRGENFNFFSYNFRSVMFYFQPGATNWLGERIMGWVRYEGL